ncbi:hypothetical protein Tco_0962453 [Tanacetum coccineum]
MINNRDPLVFGPAFAIGNVKGLSCPWTLITFRRARVVFRPASSSQILYADSNSPVAIRKGKTDDLKIIEDLAIHDKDNNG